NPLTCAPGGYHDRRANPIRHAVGRGPPGLALDRLRKSRMCWLLLTPAPGTTQPHRTGTDALSQDAGSVIYPTVPGEDSEVRHSVARLGGSLVLGFGGEGTDQGNRCLLFRGGLTYAGPVPVRCIE